ncbi:MAG TPA: hypothetical protein VHD81_05265 [Mycobacteriales bacterium]|nr:hypothetical protein [Mycobacteriales bacterium]
MPCSHCEPWRLDDVASTLAAVDRQVPLVAGSTYIAVFDLMGALVGARRLADDVPERTGHPPGTSAIRSAVTALIGDDIGPLPPDYVTHLVRCRDGYVVWAPDDPAWGYALIYGVQMMNTYVGEVIVVTPHGWTMGRGRAAGRLPTLSNLSPAGNVVPLRPPSPGGP